MQLRAPAGAAEPRWCSENGEVIACVEKIKVLNQNLVELGQVAQDALEDGLLMGCSEAQLRLAFHALIDRLVNPYGMSDREQQTHSAES